MFIAARNVKLRVNKNTVIVCAMVPLLNLRRGLFSIASCTERIRNGISYGQIHLVRSMHIFPQVKNDRLKLHQIVYERRREAQGSQYVYSCNRNSKYKKILIYIR